MRNVSRWRMQSYLVEARRIVRYHRRERITNFHICLQAIKRGRENTVAWLGWEDAMWRSLVLASPQFLIASYTKYYSNRNFVCLTCVSRKSICSCRNKSEQFKVELFLPSAASRSPHPRPTPSKIRRQTNPELSATTLWRFAEVTLLDAKTV